MLVEAVLFLVMELLVIVPVLRNQREERLARRLEQARDPLEASLLVDGVISDNRSAERTVKSWRDRLWPFLFRP
jgi:hypothetical protein